MKPEQYVDSISKDEQINQAILKAEQCFEPFCKEHAQEACPQDPSFGQSLLGISPCNDELCAGRFIPNEAMEVVRGVFKPLSTVDKQKIQRCKGIKPFKGKRITPIRLRRQQHEET